MGGLEMTVYEYRCQLCGDEMDVEAPIGTAAPSFPCASCGGRASRIVSSPLFLRGTANTEEVWNPQLGIAHRNHQQAAEHIKKLNDTQGTNYTLDI